VSDASSSQPRVAFQGARGAFSEIAVRKLFPLGAEPVPCRTFEDLFAAIDTGAAELILAPLENTLAGPVYRCYDLLYESQLQIIAEVGIPVVHCLIACEGATLATLATVESHPVALAQCERFLCDHPTVQRRAADDTAASVEAVLAAGDLTRAAIASAAAARLYGGTILREHIEDDPNNFTRFALLSPPRPYSHEADTTSIALTLPNVAGSLWKSLGPFATRNLDLLNIVSRPLKGEPWHYRFFLDVAAPLSHRPVADALDELDKSAHSVRVFGSYLSNRFDLANQQAQFAGRTKGEVPRAD